MFQEIALKVASTLIVTLIKSGYKKISSSDYTPYEKELKEIILFTIVEFEKLYPIAETEKIPFYSSQTVFEELLKSRFTGQLNIEQLKEAINKDSRIIFPTDFQLQQFFSIFNSKLNHSSKLKDLNIEFHYKEEVFRISQKLEETRDIIISTVKDFQKDIRELNIGTTLTEEWSKQLDEILEYIQNFKAVTALDRIEKLEKRITAAEVDAGKKLFSRLYYLQALCLGQMEGNQSGTREPELLVKAYILNPQNQNYKAYAALGYYILKDFDKASELVAQILETDPFNTRAWATQCFLAEANFRNILERVPQTVKQKNDFKIHLFQWLNSKGFLTIIEEFIELGLEFEFDFDKEPEEITYRNRYASIIYAVYLLTEFYQSVRMFSTMLEIPKATESKKYIYANKILNKLIQKLKGTEIEEFHRHYFFQYYCTNLILTGELSNVSAMEREFNLLKNKSHDEVIRIAQAYNNLNTEEGTRLSIGILEDYGDSATEIILLFCFLNYSILREEVKTEEYAIKYLRFYSEISSEVFLNITSALRQKRLKLTEALRIKLIDLSNNNKGDPIIKRLLKVVLYLLTKTEFATVDGFHTELKALEKELENAPESYYLHLAFGYAEIERFDEGIRFLKGKISFDRPSEGLKLYCKLLYKSQGNKPELLELLKRWRTEFKEPDYELLDMEAYFSRLNKNWKEQARIAKFALDAFPKSQHFLYLLFTGLGEDQDIAGIRDQANLLDGVEFKDEGYGVATAMSLIKAERYQQALDLLFRQASIKSNIKSRQSLLMLSVHFPPNLMKEQPEVAIGCVVKYELNGETHLLEITEENHQHFPQSTLQGKKIGDSFNFTHKFGAAIQTGKILRICDKYLGLFEEILKEAANPMSGMDIMTYKFEGNSIEEINKTFIENFGIQGTLQRDHSQKLLQEYYLGNLSFSEITIQLFGNAPIDAYYTLSHPKGNSFKAISAAVSSQTQITQETKVVLDLTSVCLLCELSNKIQIKYDRKFIISSLLKALIVNKIADIRNSPESKLSLSITHESVHPHFYPENYNARRIEQLENILRWVEQNCDEVDVPERFNFIMELPEEHKHNAYLQLILDNKLLADQKSSVLITDDIFYYRKFLCPVNLVVGTQLYLYRYHGDKEKAIIDHLLEHNYIGVPMSSDKLNEELLKFLSGKENRYAICLENLRYSWNPYAVHAGEAIKFIKSLYLGSFINDLTRQQVVSAVLSNLLVGLPIRNARLLPQLILREFKLLPMQQLQVLDILSRILDKK